MPVGMNPSDVSVRRV